MNVRLESTCLGDGKIYLQMVVDRLIDDAVVGVQAHAKDGSEIPSLLLPFHPADGHSQANFIVVMPHFSLREVDLDFEEFGASDKPVSRGHLTVELNNVGWRSRFNQFVRNDLVSQMLDIEHEYSAGRMNVYLTSAVDDGDEIVVRMLVDMPNVPDADVMVDFLDDRGHGFDLPVYPLVDEVMPATRIGDDEHLRIEFSVRVPRGNKDFCVKVYDASEFIEGGFARFCDETYVPLRDRTESQLADATYDEEYPLWYYQHRATLSELEVQRQTSLPYEPLISLIVPLAPADRKLAFIALDALLRQSYDLFEVVVVDKCSQEYSYDGLLSAWAGDPRLVRIAVSEDADDATCMATGLMQARGSYRAVLHPSVVLAPEALFFFVRKINEPIDSRGDFWTSGWSGQRAGAGVPDQMASVAASLGEDPIVLYCDHDHLDVQGGLYAPELKPVCAPDFLRAYPYVGPFVMFSAEVIKTVAEARGFASEGFMHDLLLKAWELGAVFCRVSNVLYHVQDVDATDMPLKALTDERIASATRGSRKALAQHLRRMGRQATVVSTPFGMSATYHLPNPAPRISIVMFGADNLERLSLGVERLLKAEEMLPFQLVIADSSPDKRAAAKLHAEIKKAHPDTEVVVHDGVLSRSSLANAAVRLATGTHLLFLDAATELVSPDSLAILVLECLVPGVGIVGGKVLLPDDTIAHAGTIIGVNGGAGFAGVGLPRTRTGYLNRFAAPSEVSAVSMNCMMVSREAYDKVGGFDERFRMGLADADFCLQAAKHGYRCVLCPQVEAYDHRSTNPERLITDDQRLRFEQERAYFRYRWPRYFVAGDPYLSDSLDWQSAYYRIWR